jgi:putative transposase
MREHGLLAPTPKVRRRARRLHDGRISTDTPDELWATDPTEAWTRLDGRCAVFAIVDHGTGEVWVDAAPRMDRWAAADLLREAVLDRFGSVEAGAAAGLKLRHDGGSCFRSGHYQAEIDHLGLECSPAFVYEPETNGVVEKFLQTLKEQVLWIERFDTLAQLRAASASSPRTSTSTGCSNATATAHPAKRAPPSPAPLKPWHDHRRQVSQVSGDPGAAQGLRRLTEGRH